MDTKHSTMWCWTWLNFLTSFILYNKYPFILKFCAWPYIDDYKGLALKNTSICLLICLCGNPFFRFECAFDNSNVIISKTCSKTKWFLLYNRRQGCNLIMIGCVTCYSYPIWWISSPTFGLKKWPNYMFDKFYFTYMILGGFKWIKKLSNIEPLECIYILTLFWNLILKYDIIWMDNLILCRNGWN